MKMGTPATTARLLRTSWNVTVRLQASVSAIAESPLTAEMRNFGVLLECTIDSFHD